MSVLLSQALGIAKFSQGRKKPYYYRHGPGGMHDVPPLFFVHGRCMLLFRPCRDLKCWLSG